MPPERTAVVRLAFESLLIVFSVLLALFLDEAWTRRSERRVTGEQLASIRAEIAANQAILTEWAERHGAIAANVVRLRVEDGEEPLFDDGRLRLERVLGRSLAETMVRDTAWETAKTTGTVRRFELSCANLLTDIYGLQQVVERTIWEIADLLGERATHDPELLRQTLVLLEIHLQELLGQERLLAGAYDDALAAFDAGRCEG